MSAFDDHITDALQRFIGEQRMFFIATAPAEGRINLSPKGMDTFRVLDANRVAYLDFTGSGNETAAHLHENGRVTLMFCGFEKKPNIVRLYGSGRVVTPSDPAWTDLSAHFSILPGARQIMVVAVTSVQSSCGYAVPKFTFEGARETLTKWAAHKGDEGLETYRKTRNQTSIDGLAVYPAGGSGEG
ncbi:MAG: hypothetical protein ACI9MR_000948 [Myxococcota bacterium]|jgi:hypothetical protein